MNNVKLYHVGDNGLQEGEALGRISVVLKADYELEVWRLQAQLTKVAGDGEVEVISYLYQPRNAGPWPRHYKVRQDNMIDWIETELVDRVNVTYLTAENVRLQSEIKRLQGVVVAQADELSHRAEGLKVKDCELTKARELFREVWEFSDRLPDDIRDRIHAFTGHQSAPITKGE